jgi:hypothetical protein
MVIENLVKMYQKFKMLPLMLQYIFCLLTFMTNNRDQLFINSEIHSVNIRYSSNLYLLMENLNVYQKGVYYSGIKIFSRLSLDIRMYFDNSRTVKKAVKRFLYTNPRHSLDEYYNNRNNRFFNVVDSLILII